jgi:signal transduction histidine kinase
MNGEDSERLRRTEALERLMLALRDAREPYDILAIVARNLGFEFGRPCTAYEFRDLFFRPVVASEGTQERGPIAAGALNFEELRAHAVTRVGPLDLVPVSIDGQMRALFALEQAATALDDEEMKFLHAVAAHTALALTTAFSFEQLRRYAAEGAALTEAARTILGFTELEPLAEALSRLALRLVHAECVCVYGRREGGERLNLLGSASSAKHRPLPEYLPASPGAALAVLRETFGEEAPLLATPMAFPLAGGPDHGGLMVVTRRRDAFEKVETRVVEALVTLAALAIRNVELYEQSTRANRALAESNAFKDDLMAMFAHDFKGPLTVISGFAELLLESADPETESSARTIMAQAVRLAKLAEDALALAATQSAGFSLRREREDLVEFVREAVGSLAEAGRVEVEASAPVVVPFDRSRLRHVIDNVVGNALKYSKGKVEVAVRRDAGAAVVIVADHGIGIPQEELERVFERFGRGSNTSRRGIAGTGVGLYIARKIVEVHGGRLDVASREDEGSTFTLALPL